jgi:hypothetical protein
MPTESTSDAKKIFAQKRDEKYRQLAEFHSQEALALQTKYSHIKKLIGRDHHNPTAGYHCEMLIKEYLRVNLPRHYSVDTGFIRCNPQDVISTDERTGIKSYDCVIASPQIDILIHNEATRAPIYRTGDCVIVEPEAVVAIVEVKKNLTKNKLLEGLANLSEAFSVVRNDRIVTSERIFLGIFSFDTTLGKNGKTFEDALSTHCTNDRILPASITVLSKFFSRIDYQNNKYNVKYWEAYSGKNELLLSLQGFLYFLKERIGISIISRFQEHVFPSLKSPQEFTIELSNTNVQAKE